MNFFRKIKDYFARAEREQNFTCDSCEGELFDGKRLCPACRAKLSFNDGVVCPLCGRRTPSEGVCLECKAQPPETDLARSLWVHEGLSAKLVRDFKAGKKYLVHLFSEELLPLAKREFPDADAVAFVPMTKRALRKRGYNQSRLLAERVAEGTGKPLLDVAEKKRETLDQRKLTRRERQENMAGSFRVTDRAAVKGKRILIVDDTFTTGATTGVLARALKRAGAGAVYVLTLTSVENRHPFGLRQGEIRE